jgi:hypothetical protein
MDNIASVIIIIIIIWITKIIIVIPLNCTIATFAEDTAIMATGNTLDESTTKLQQAADDIATWARKCRIKLNETNSTYINFTNQKIDQPSILLNDVRIPPANTAKYLGRTLDAKLRWKAYIKKKQE